MNDKPHIVDNPWQALRQLTQARIALGRTGASLPTSAQLDFQLAHARARDAVHAPLDAAGLASALELAGHSSLTVQSACPDRPTYLQRPDLGRMLDDASRGVLTEAAGAPCDLALVLADGLSALAIERNALPFLQALAPALRQEQWSLAPIVIARQARVALGDEIGALLRARVVAVLIGERPGLSSPDSMGIYLTFAPGPGLSDANRNCISNVRPAGLGYPQAADRLHYLLAQARLRGLSGIALKDETGLDNPLLEQRGNFLIE